MHATTLNILIFYGLFVAGWIGLVMIEYNIKMNKKRRVQKEQEKNALFWRIRNLEMDIYGRWLDLDDNKDLAIPIEQEDDYKYGE